MATASRSRKSASDVESFFLMRYEQTGAWAAVAKRSQAKAMAETPLGRVGGDALIERVPFVPVRTARRYIVVEGAWEPITPRYEGVEYGSPEYRQHWDAWHESVLAQQPPRHALDMRADISFDTEFWYEPSDRVTREKGLRQVVEKNRATIAECVDWGHSGIDWSVLLEFGQPLDRAIFCASMPLGGVGYFDVTQKHAIRLVHPTPEEVKRLA